MLLLSVVVLFLGGVLQNATADLLSNQTVRDILVKNKCLCSCRTSSSGSQKFSIPFNEGTWFEAVSHCNSIGMSIVQIRNEFDNDDLKEWLDNYGDGPSANYWIGANDLAIHGVFHWGLNIKQVRFAPWASGEPNAAVIRGEKEHCVELKAQTMKWNDSVCSKRLKFICESLN